MQSFPHNLRSDDWKRYPFRLEPRFVFFFKSYSLYLRKNSKKSYSRSLMSIISLSSWRTWLVVAATVSDVGQQVTLFNVEQVNVERRRDALHAFDLRHGVERRFNQPSRMIRFKIFKRDEHPIFSFSYISGVLRFPMGGNYHEVEDRNRDIFMDFKETMLKIELTLISNVFLTH